MLASLTGMANDLQIPPLLSQINRTPNLELVSNELAS